MFRTNGSRLLGAIVLGFTTASAIAAPAQAASQRSSLNIRQLNVVTTFTTAKFTVAANVATQLVINTGTDKVYMVSTPDRSKLKHVVTVRGMAPNTNYYYSLVLTPKTGKARTVRNVFKTAAPGSSPATLSVRGSKILLNGQPFFPIMADSYACPTQADVTAIAQMGFNIIDGPNSCSNEQTQDVQNLHALLSGKLKLWYTPSPPRGNTLALQGLPELLAWPRGVSFTTEMSTGSCNRPADNKLLGKFYASLVHGAHLKTSMFYSNISNPPVQGKVNCLDNPSTYSLLWSVTSAGVKGIELTATPQWNTGMGVSTTLPVATATSLFAKRLATLLPVILFGQKVAVRLNLSGTVEASAWRYGGVTYVIVVNLGTMAASQTTAVPGLASAKTAQVLWESRGVKVVDGSITDNYPRSAPVHIYRINSAKK